MAYILPLVWALCSVLLHFCTAENNALDYVKAGNITKHHKIEGVHPALVYDFILFH